jgi:tetratricopeptide (TPR) repeat protein
VTGQPDNVLFDAIHELQNATVLEADEHGDYRFAQQQLQDLLYTSLSLEAKTVLHGTVVGALEHRIWGKEIAELTFEDVRALAFHSLKGNVPEKTIVYALETGARSLALNAFSTAEQFLSDGLALVRLEPGGRWKKHLLDYLRLLADAYRAASKHLPAKELLLEAIPISEEVGKPLVLGRMLTSLAKSCQVLTEYVEALTYAERSAEIAASVNDLAGEARALMTIGRVHFFKGRLSEALVCAERAVTIGRASNDATILAAAFAMGGYFYVASGEPAKLEEGVRNLNESLALLEIAGDKIGLINSMSFLGNAQVMLGDYLDAWSTFTRMRSLAYESGSKDDEIVALVNLATTALELGNVKESVERAREARELVDKRGSSKYAKGLAFVVEAVSGLYSGQPAKSRAMAQEALDFVREIKNKYVEALALPYQMEVLLQLGRLAEAKAIGESLQALIAETGNTEPEGRLNVLMADLLGREGDLPLARDYANRALEAALAAQSKGLQVRASRTLAWLEMLSEDWEAAYERASNAFALANRVGAKAMAQELAGILGELALARGCSQVECEGHFRVMEVMARQTDMPQSLALAYFGLAACDPCKPASKALAEDGAQRIREIAATLDVEGAAYFVSVAERKRVMDGDRHAFSLPRRLSNRGQALWLKIRTLYRGALGPS